CEQASQYLGEQEDEHHNNYRGNRDVGELEIGIKDPFFDNVDCIVECSLKVFHSFDQNATAEIDLCLVKWQVDDKSMASRLVKLFYYKLLIYSIVLGIQLGL
ncbi:hypothetical protein, partial [Moorena sp. SIO1F2]|uniref:hypothetical protein n=1 Tax=Moorena sp. SIO1F2 TaxID=2607819 RepID=UPI0025CC0DD7